MTARLAGIVLAALLIGAAGGAAVYFTTRDDEDPAGPAAKAVPSTIEPPPPTQPKQDPGPPPNPLAVAPAPRPLPVSVEFRDPPRAGLLFDVESGEVLWALNPFHRGRIASLTKMMTALLIAERHRPGERVLITRRATRFGGSGIGLLPAGKRVRLEPLLYGLMLVSGNDAAIALAQHDAGGIDAFVERMNRRARRLRLDCTRFSSPSGILDRGTFSCPYDLATMARMVLANRRLREIVGARRGRFRFPVKGGVLDLFNINPFIARGDVGVTGVKTGLTSAAGRCYVITARIAGRHLGVVLLDTPDPLKQVPRLLQAGSRSG